MVSAAILGSAQPLPQPPPSFAKLGRKLKGRPPLIARLLWCASCESTFFYQLQSQTGDARRSFTHFITTHALSAHHGQFPNTSSNPTSSSHPLDSEQNTSRCAPFPGSQLPNSANLRLHLAILRTTRRRSNCAATWRPRCSIAVNHLYHQRHHLRLRCCCSWSPSLLRLDWLLDDTVTTRSFTHSDPSVRRRNHPLGSAKINNVDLRPKPPTPYCTSLTRVTMCHAHYL